MEKELRGMREEAEKRNEGSASKGVSNEIK